MPKGVPVATVAIGNAANAGILAAQIIGVSDEQLLNKVRKYKDSLIDMIAKKNKSMVWR
jgi:5-(carboxyamino)imidazole ribonucleotide mutase